MFSLSIWLDGISIKAASSSRSSLRLSMQLWCHRKVLVSAWHALCLPLGEVELYSLWKLQILQPLIDSVSSYKAGKEVTSLYCLWCLRALGHLKAKGSVFCSLFWEYYVISLINFHNFISVVYKRFGWVFWPHKQGPALLPVASEVGGGEPLSVIIVKVYYLSTHLANANFTP